MPNSIDSNNSSRSDNESESESEEKTFINTLINEVLDEWPVGKIWNETRIYEEIVEKAKSSYLRSLAMDNDDFWKDIVEKANKYKDNVTSNMSDSSALVMAMTKYKLSLMEDINQGIDNWNNDSEDVDDDVMQTDDDDRDDVTQSGGGGEAYDDDDDESVILSKANKYIASILCRRSVRFGKW